MSHAMLHKPPAGIQIHRDLTSTTLQLPLWLGALNMMLKRLGLVLSLIHI